MPKSATPGPDRRTRIVAVAAELASEGGFDAVRMRAVAAGTPVALATLYRHFPSKLHLLAAVLQADLDRMGDRVDRVILRDQGAHERLMTVVGSLSRAMQRDPRRSEATTRALVSADPGAAAEIAAARASIVELFARAMSPGDPTDDQRAVARIVGDVWLANLVAWVGGRATPQDVVRRVADSAALVLGERDARDLF